MFDFGLSIHFWTIKCLGAKRTLNCILPSLSVRIFSRPHDKTGKSLSAYRSMEDFSHSMIWYYLLEQNLMVLIVSKAKMGNGFVQGKIREIVYERIYVRKITQKLESGLLRTNRQLCVFFQSQLLNLGRAPEIYSLLLQFLWVKY